MELVRKTQNSPGGVVGAVVVYHDYLVGPLPTEGVVDPLEQLWDVLPFVVCGQDNGDLRMVNFR